MAKRLMFLQLKTGHDTDRGPAWIGWVEFNRSWKTARYRGRELRRDRSDMRYGPGAPSVDEDARETYEAFLNGAPLPGRETG